MQWAYRAQTMVELPQWANPVKTHRVCKITISSRDKVRHPYNVEAKRLVIQTQHMKLRLHKMAPRFQKLITRNSNQIREVSKKRRKSQITLDGRYFSSWCTPCAQRTTLWVVNFSGNGTPRWARSNFSSIEGSLRVCSCWYTWVETQKNSWLTMLIPRISHPFHSGYSRESSVNSSGITQWLSSLWVWLELYRNWHQLSQSYSPTYSSVRDLRI